MAGISINHQKIQQKAQELNAKDNTNSWVAVSGMNTFASFKITEDGKVNMGLDEGYPIQIFFNTNTQEIKMFPGAIFLNKE